MNILKTHPNWPPLIEGKISCQFRTVSASMLLSRLGREYKSNPTPQKMSSLINEAYEFFQKYENIFKDDLAKIFQ
jgi:hypothetical protein